MARLLRDLLNFLDRNRRHPGLVVIGAVVMILTGFVLSRGSAVGLARQFILASGYVGVAAFATGLVLSIRQPDVSRNGIVGVWRPRDSRGFGDRLARARSLAVIKAWFSEDDDMQNGLQRALENNHADIQLILWRESERLESTRELDAWIRNRGKSRMP